MERLKYLPKYRLVMFLVALSTIVLTMAVSLIAVIIRFNDEGNIKNHVFFFNATQSTLSLDDTTSSDSTTWGTSEVSASTATTTKNAIVLDKFLIEVDFYAVDIAGSLIRARVHITVPPQFRAVTKNDTTGTKFRVPSSSIPNMAIAAVIGSRVSQFTAGKLIEDFDITISLNGDLSDYPFDSYESMAYFTLYRSDGFGNRTAKFPIGIAITGALQGFKIDSSTASFTEIDGSDEVGFLFGIRRSPITIGFSSFITTLMWLISIVVFVVALDVVVAAASSTHIPVPPEKLLVHTDENVAREMFYKQIKDYRKARQVSAPLLAMPVALIFALPALRNVQPGVPVVGAYCDVVGFFWNVGLVAMAAVGISTVWLIRRDI